VMNVFFESGFPWGHQMAVPDCAKNGADFEDLEAVEESRLA
jgi:hypothetical protein